ncbi:hypothetical protein OC845_001297 [Tilletia horrida]|nr:hypothetical protein OC845_001297 [Tilletia horrida]
MPSSPPGPPSTILIVSLLIPASMLGTLTRIGSMDIFTFPGTPLDPPIMWAQIIGCAVFGGALQNKAHFDKIILSSKRSGAIPVGAALYTALTTGYCGSVTTFSTWILDIYLAFANFDAIEPGLVRSSGKRFLAGLGQSFVTLLISVASFRLGMKLAEPGEPFHMEWLIRLLPSHLQKAEPDERASMETSSHIPSSRNGYPPTTPDVNSSAVTQEMDPKSRIWFYTIPVCFGIGLIVMCSLLAALYPPTRSISLALVLSPPGAIMRWYLSRFNGKSSWLTDRFGRQGNSRPKWPYGTFTANMIGVMLVCGTYTALHTAGKGAAPSFYSPITCVVLYSGLEVGLSGALSTISTFVAELYTFSGGLRDRRDAVSYAFISWASGLILCLLLIAAPLASNDHVDRCPAS